MDTVRRLISSWRQSNSQDKGPKRQIDMSQQNNSLDDRALPSTCRIIHTGPFVFREYDTYTGYVRMGRPLESDRWKRFACAALCDSRNAVNDRPGQAGTHRIPQSRAAKQAAQISGTSAPREVCGCQYRATQEPIWTLNRLEWHPSLWWWSEEYLSNCVYKQRRVTMHVLNAYATKPTSGYFAVASCASRDMNSIPGLRIISFFGGLVFGFCLLTPKARRGPSGHPQMHTFLLFFYSSML